MEREMKHMTDHSTVARPRVSSLEMVPEERPMQAPRSHQPVESNTLARTESPVNRKGGIVFTSGAFDLLHVGHVRIIQAAAALGDTLIVAVSTDELISEYKGHAPAVPYEERRELVAALQGVDAVIPQRSQDKFAMWERLRFDRWVHGDDWFDSDKFQHYRQQLEAVGVDCIFLPYTSGVSSTLRRTALGA
jgi:glycerol-3-phosphate cytidylyltransferase